MKKVLGIILCVFFIATVAYSEDQSKIKQIEQEQEKITKEFSDAGGEINMLYNKLVELLQRRGQLQERYSQLERIKLQVQKSEPKPEANTDKTQTE